MSTTKFFSMTRVVAALAVIAVVVPSTAAAATKGGETAPAPAAEQTVVYLEAGSTGQGPADDKECDRRAAAINSWSDQANADVINGDAEGAERSAGYVEALEDEALDRGCFIVY